jgi:hypothetical protein
MERTMDIAAKIDEQGKWAWIALMVVGFIVFWPIGLALLFYLMWSGRMGCWKNGHVGRRNGPGRWYGVRGAAGGSSGNTAFDEYKAETLRRLEDEQKEFVDFLDRLRQSKDKAEFDQFMADRRNRPAPESPDADAPQPQG